MSRSNSAMQWASAVRWRWKPGRNVATFARRTSKPDWRCMAAWARTTISVCAEHRTTSRPCWPGRSPTGPCSRCRRALGLTDPSARILAAGGRIVRGRADRTQSPDFVPLGRQPMRSAILFVMSGRCVVGGRAESSAAGTLELGQQKESVGRRPSRRKKPARNCTSANAPSATVRRRRESERRPRLRQPGVSQARRGAAALGHQNGAIFHGMPSFAHLPEPERWQIVTFLQSLNHGPD